MPHARNVATPIHGRYLLEERDPERFLVGFHGYAETAEKHLAELERIPGIDRWSVVAVQALHPFYVGRTGAIVASWMTSLDRELTIDDNVEYVRRVLEDLPIPRTLVFAGFSQGAAMAYRAAALLNVRAAGLIVLGERVPAEAKREGVVLPPVLLGRGTADEWYGEEKFKEDLSFLATRTEVASCIFAGGHEWTDEFRRAAGAFLARVSALPR